jgi:hypothetical protein
MTEFSDTGPGEPNVPLGPPPGAPPYAYPPGGYYPPPPYSRFPPMLTPARNGLGTGALITGILAVVTCWTIVGGLAFGIVAAVIGLVARGQVKRGEATNGGAALVGTLLGIAAAGLSGVILAILIVLFQTGVFNEDYQHCLGEHNGMAQYCEQYR